MLKNSQILTKVYNLVHLKIKGKFDSKLNCPILRLMTFETLDLDIKILFFYK